MHLEDWGSSAGSVLVVAREFQKDIPVNKTMLAFLSPDVLELFSVVLQFLDKGIYLIDWHFGRLRRGR